MSWIYLTTTGPTTMRIDRCSRPNRVRRSPARTMLFVLLTGIWTFGCASGGSQDAGSNSLPTDQSVANLPLRPGDAIRLSFSREPELNGEYPIDATGVASLPALGNHVVTDSPVTAMRTTLTEEYARILENQSVQVIALRRVRVLGEVRQPGLYFVDATMTFGDAIALAGGAESDGNLNDVRLIRDGDQVIEGLDVTLSVAAALKSADQIFVPRTSWFNRYGAVIIAATISAVGFIVAVSR